MSANDKTRTPAVAGQFYPADPSRLKAMVDGFLDDSNAPRSRGGAEGKTRAIISPHAGYVYSGATAGKVFAETAGETYSRVLLLAPSHRMPFAGIALSGCDAFSTPIGDLKVDQTAVGELSGHKLFQTIEQAHEAEHSLEVQLPFVAALFPDIPILPLVCGQMNEKLADEAAAALNDLWNDDTLWMVSSDFTHYGEAFAYVPFTDRIPERLRELDMGAVRKILNLDPAGFADYLAATGATICGAVPINVILRAAAFNGGREMFDAELVELTNSGELTGDFSHSVGYAGIVIREKRAPGKGTEKR